MKQFKLVDNILGWLSFLIAAFVYCSTIEPTASFWDCPEFIATGYKLEIGHPPGAPFFMLTANLFSQFVSDPSQVARMVNTMSALLSAACIMFLFWTITHLVRKLIVKESDYVNGALALPLRKLIAIEASGLVGALIYTFSDTFWYSAVEGEVYAYSSAFTAVVFWLILKWEDHADEPHSDRWLVLITYMTGLSIGVHLLNLLCVPAIVLVFYYKRFPNADLKGSLMALCVSGIIVAAILYGVVPGIITVGGWFELFFVNTMGMPFNTGVIVYIILLVAIVLWAIYESHTDRSPIRQNIAFLAAVAMLGIPFYGYGVSAVIIGIIVLAILWVLVSGRIPALPRITARIKNTATLCMLMLMIGYSSYALIVIRSSANPPMDQNSPEDIFTLGEYLGREQYGQRPLLYGQAYSSQVALEQDGEYCKPMMTHGDPIWQRKEKASPDEKDEYFVVRTKDEYIYAQNMLFPRMYSSAHRDAYESWMGGIDCTESEFDRCGEMITVRTPTQVENLRFFISYQCNFMYWRYFMWNFAGRQNDLQGNGELEHGNWLSGFRWLDDWRLGDQDLLPDELKENKGHNVYYMLPLLLGLIGLFWQSLAKHHGSISDQTGIRQFWVVFFLFFMTGLAIVVYLNQTPMQPRERDYAYAGSFYAFAIWCGMGVAAIIEIIREKLKVKSEKFATALACIVSIACLLVPVQMASQNWDDHDRSGRYTCRDFGQNYLMSLQQEGNPIIYTNGDNDTFPLWYNQDVEGVRTDARVCNLSYLQTDWYIDQMRRPAYDSPSVPISWERIEYCSGTNEYVTIDPRMKDIISEVTKQYPKEAQELFGDHPYELKNVLKYWIRGQWKDNQKQILEMLFGKGNYSHIIPTDTLYMTIDKEAVRKSGMLIASDSIPDKMVISLKGKRALYKGDLMILEMLDQCNWQRPIYVAVSVGDDNYINLGDNVITEGLAYRITPFTTQHDGKPLPGVKNFDTERTYDNIMHRFKFGGLEQRGIYLDETVMRMCYTHRRIMSRLAVELIYEGKDQKAREVLNYATKMIPDYNVPHSYASGSIDMARAWASIGDKQKSLDIVNKMWKNATQYVKWYCSLVGYRFESSKNDVLVQMYILQQLNALTTPLDKGLAEKQLDELDALAKLFEQRGGSFYED
jgi:phage shock protein PspC (stress-responsive transcriptional regulator)